MMHWRKGGHGGVWLGEVRQRWGGFARRRWGQRWRLHCRRCRALPLYPLRASGKPLEGRLALPLFLPALASLTDDVWTLREVLLFRVPPWPQPAGV
jgi:hypothetical protein